MSKRGELVYCTVAFLAVVLRAYWVAESTLAFPPLVLSLSLKLKVP